MSFSMVFYSLPSSLVETVETSVSIKTRTTLSKFVWFLMVKFEQVWNIILLHLKGEFLLKILK